MDDAIRDYLARTGVAQVEEACLAVASPVRGTQVRMTNNHWRFDSEVVRQQFGWTAFKVINDFTAMALGVLHVTEDRLVAVCGGEGNPARPRLVMGPGTGMGVSGLIPTNTGRLPLMTEGGHVDYAPTDDLEVASLGILPRFLHFFLESNFQHGFEDKGRMRPLLEATPVFVVTEKYTGLLGAAEALRNPEV
ncbi:MAG: glucokinase [Marinobacter sp.]|nr:glucokinase [Marinobacter sp.]MDX1756573.1 glucokinase [Marinobacter sp.]